MYSYFFDPPDFAKNLIEISFIAYLTRKLLKKKKKNTEKKQPREITVLKKEEGKERRGSKEV